MKSPTSGFVDTGETSVSEVTAIETTMVCYLTPTKSGDQTPKCTIKSIRVLKEPPRTSGMQPVEEKEPPDVAAKADEAGSAGVERRQMCSLPLDEQTQEEQVDTLLECMVKNDDEHTGSQSAEKNPGRRKWKFNKKGDAS
jgi:hypothetical protein